MSLASDPLRRWIAHVDMDSFYVSVERLHNPKLNGLPVVVGGKGLRSVVSSASYEARKFGVRSAMPMAQARRLCQKLVIVEPHFSLYSELSRKVFSELESIAPIVEQVSVDEAYLDFTGCERLYSSREVSALITKKTVRESSGLIATVGVATNKLVAKIASDTAKPDGQLVIPAGEEAKFLAPLSVRKLSGVGPKTSLILERLGIMTCGDLVLREKSWLKKNLGDYALSLWQAARGEDDSPVVSEGERKTLSSEETFERDIGAINILCEKLRIMSEDLATTLREESLLARTIQIKLRYSDFSTLTRALTLNEPTHMAEDIYRVSRELLKKNKAAGVEVRLLGINVRNFVKASETVRQLGFFEDENQRVKKDKVEFLKDELKRKYGKDILK